MTKKESYVHYIPERIVNPDESVEIALVGAGGTGSALLSGLARINYSLLALGHEGLLVYVFDGDNVSEANVGRQLFSMADVGLNKAVVQVTRINNFFGFNWRAYPSMFMPKTIEKARNTQIVISAVDNAKARAQIKHSIKGRTLYYLDCGNTVNTGQVVLGTASEIRQPKLKGVKTVGHLPDVIDLYPEMEVSDKESIQGPSCSLAESLRRQDLFINQQVATAALRLLWKMFRKGKIAEHGCFINLESPTPERMLPINPEMWRRMTEDKTRRQAVFHGILGEAQPEFL